MSYDGINWGAGPGSEHHPTIPPAPDNRPSTPGGEGAPKDPVYTPPRAGSTRAVVPPYRSTTASPATYEPMRPADSDQPADHLTVGSSFSPPSGPPQSRYPTAEERYSAFAERAGRRRAWRWGAVLGVIGVGAALAAGQAAPDRKTPSGFLCRVTGVAEESPFTGSVTISAAVAGHPVRIHSGSEVRPAAAAPEDATTFTYDASNLHNQTLTVSVGSVTCAGSFTIGRQGVGDEHLQG